MAIPKRYSTLPGVADFMPRADYQEIASIRGDCDLEAFIHGFLLSPPRWFNWLMKLRNAAMKMVPGHEVTESSYDTPLPLRRGERIGPFETISTDAETWWAAGAAESHLSALMIITRQPESGSARFDVATLVSFHNGFGKLYFTLIKPFHHLIVWAFLRKAVKTGS